MPRDFVDMYVHRDIASEAYQQAVKFIEKEFKSKQDAYTLILSQCTSIEDVQSAVQKAKDRYESSVAGRKDVLNSLHKVSARIIYYSKVLDVLAQHHPEYVALAWGAMKFVLIVSCTIALFVHLYVRWL